MIRWACPNGHPAVLGPKAPRTDATCRFCLTCSATAARMVRRVPEALERQRQAKAERERTKRRAAAEARAELRRIAQVAKREAAEAEAERQKETARYFAQQSAIDYNVKAGATSTAYSTLRGPGGALEHVARLQQRGAAFQLFRIGKDRQGVGSFHGKRLVAWHDLTTGVSWPAEYDK